MINKPALLLFATVFLQPLAQAQEAVQWGSTDKPTARQPTEGIKAYYEPEKVEHNGDVFSFTLYRDSTGADEVGRYLINCETRESASNVKGLRTPPSPLLAGEALYPIGKKLCEWDQKGFFKKLLD